jgi:hypothetical protein
LIYALNLKDGIRSRLLKAFVNHLKSDPQLSSAVKTWDDYSARAEDFRVIPVESTPAIRFSVSCPASSPASFNSYTGNFSIDMEVIVPGTNQYDMINLSEAIETAVHPFFEGDKAMLAALKGDQTCIYATHMLTGSAINHQKYSNPPCMVGTSSVSVILNIRRP